MLKKIKDISKEAQAIISQALVIDANNTNFKRLLDAYQKLDQLIEDAEKQNAVVGLWILSYQLGKNKDKLNAVVVMQNFLNVLTYPTHTSFAAGPGRERCIDFAKSLSLIPLLFIMPILAVALPGVFINLAALPTWLLLAAVCSLPLLLTYCFDNPYSMSRWYQEMSGMEKIFAFILFFTAFCILVNAYALITSGITLVGVAGILASLIVPASILIWHSQTLNTMHKELAKSQDKIEANLAAMPRSKLSCFFNQNSGSMADPEQTPAESELLTKLKQIG